MKDLEIKELYKVLEEQWGDSDNYINDLIRYSKELQEELEIYKLRHKLAIKKLNSAINHYDTEKENNAITFTKQILEGQSIEEKIKVVIKSE